MFAQFTTESLLSIRSHTHVSHLCIEIALRFAVLGYISRSIEMVNLASEIYPPQLHSLYERGLYYAWEAADSWPSVVPEEHREASWLKELDESAGMSQRIWTTQPRAVGPEEAFEKLAAEGANWASLAKSRSAWAFLKNGYFEGRLNAGEDALSEFRRLRGAMAERVETGVQRPLRNLAMQELVRRLNANTLRHDEDEDQDSFELEQLQKYLFMGNRSILHPPASGSDIQKVEQNLGVELPEDYKEFLGISNGLQGIWNGAFRQGFLGSAEMVKHSDLDLGLVQLPFGLIDWTELPVRVDWPVLDLTQAIAIHDPTDGHGGNTWLVKPQLVKKAVEAFFKTYDSETVDDETRKKMEKIVRSHFGGLEEVKEMEWCVVTLWLRGGGVLEVWKSFREFMESLVLKSKR